MQDRYAGDIGDFGKFGFLKFVEYEGLKVGVNWYPTEPVTKKESRNNDGKYGVTKSNKKFHRWLFCDKTLFEKLEKVYKGKRSVANIEKQEPLKTNCYYSDKLDAQSRDTWHAKALKKLSKCDVVFLDPDNGLEVDSAKGKSLNKYVLLKEIKSYLDRGQSVIFYNHRSRKKADKYFNDLYKKLNTITKIKPFSVSFHKGTIRDYIVLPNAKHKKYLMWAREEILNSDWSMKGFCTNDDGTYEDFNSVEKCKKLNYEKCKCSLKNNIKLEMRKGDPQDRGFLIWSVGSGKTLKFRCYLEKQNPRYNLWDVSCPEMRGSMLFTFDKKNVYGIYSDYPKNLNKKQLEVFDKATNNFWRKYYHLDNKNNK